MKVTDAEIAPSTQEPTNLPARVAVVYVQVGNIPTDGTGEILLLLKGVKLVKSEAAPLESYVQFHPVAIALVLKLLLLLAISAIGFICCVSRIPCCVPRIFQHKPLTGLALTRACLALWAMTTTA